MDAKEYKQIIYQLIEQIDNSEQRFLKQLYTIIKRHLEKKGRR